MLAIDFDMPMFFEQRKRLFSLIDRELVLDNHHKSYEGRMELCFSNRFEYDEDNPTLTIELSCYVAPIDGRGASFKHQFELDNFMDKWELELKISEE